MAETERIQESKDPRMAYVIEYFAKLQAVLMPYEDGYVELLNNWYPQYFAYWYGEIEQAVPFRRTDFEKHERLQELVVELGLNKESLWGLTLYLYDYVSDACKNLLVSQKRPQEIYADLQDFMQKSGGLASVTFKSATGKSFTLSAKLLLKYLSVSVSEEAMNAVDKQLYLSDLIPLGPGEKADSRRKASYFFAKCWVDFLQIEGVVSLKRRRDSTISNKEKELILCLLYVCKFADNPENYLDLGYFNKLMRDFKGEQMNLALKYENIPLNLVWHLQ